MKQATRIAILSTLLNRAAPSIVRSTIDISGGSRLTTDTPNSPLSPPSTSTPLNATVPPTAIDITVSGKSSPGSTIVVDFKYCDSMVEIESNIAGVFHIAMPTSDVAGCYYPSETLDSWIHVYSDEDDVVGQSIDASEGVYLGQTFGSDDSIGVVGRCTAEGCISV